MDSGKIKSLLNLLGIDGSKIGESAFDHLVGDLRGTSKRNDFLSKINVYKKFMNYHELSVDDLRRKSESIYYDLKD